MNLTRPRTARAELVHGIYEFSLFIGWFPSVHVIVWPTLITGYTVVKCLSRWFFLYNPIEFMCTHSTLQLIIAWKNIFYSIFVYYTHLLVHKIEMYYIRSKNAQIESCVRVKHILSILCVFSSSPKKRRKTKKLFTHRLNESAHSIRV